MEVQLAVLADAANIAAPGRLNILGIFNAILVRAFPAEHPRMALALRPHSSSRTDRADRSSRFPGQVMPVHSRGEAR